MSIPIPTSWRSAKADAMETQAEAVDLAVWRLEEIQGLYLDSSQRRHEVRSFIEHLKVDAENFRSEASKIRGGGGSERPS